VEAGYLGCPVISSRKFGIPELVDDERTGLLLDDPSQPAAVASAMCWMLEHADEYRQMREAAWANTRERHSKRKFEQCLLANVREGLADERMTT
jgi:glycosyltransferase involved in cell wall biosynthesis